MTSEEPDINKFPCPFCKQYSNCIIPPLEEAMSLTVEDLHKSINGDGKNLLINLTIDLINMMNEKSNFLYKSSPILMADFGSSQEKCLNLPLRYINHYIQLIDLKGLSSALNNFPQLKTILKISELLVCLEESKDGFTLDKNVFQISGQHFLDINISDLACNLAFMYYFKRSYKNEEIKFEELS